MLMFNYSSFSHQKRGSWLITEIPIVVKAATRSTQLIINFIVRFLVIIFRFRGEETRRLGDDKENQWSIKGDNVTKMTSELLV